MKMRKRPYWNQIRYVQNFVANTQISGKYVSDQLLFYFPVWEVRKVWSLNTPNTCTFWSQVIVKFSYEWLADLICYKDGS